MIVQILGWVAIADAAAAVVFAAVIYTAGQRSDPEVTMGRAIGLAVTFALPAVLLYIAARLISGLL